MDKSNINTDENLRGIPQGKKSMLLKREVIDMRLDDVFPENYIVEFFERFPQLKKDSRNHARLTNVMNARVADQKIISKLRLWYNELKKEQEAA